MNIIHNFMIALEVPVIVMEEGVAQVIAVMVFTVLP
jgi:hypothetical protein